MVTTQGDTLLPASLPIGYFPDRLILGTEFHINYAPASDRVQSCVLSMKQVHVLEMVPTRRYPPEKRNLSHSSRCCAWTQDALDVPWIVNVFRQTDSDRIIRYSYGEFGLYRFLSDRQDVYFICFGDWVGEASDPAFRTSVAPFLNDSLIILVRNQRS